MSTLMFCQQEARQASTAVPRLVNFAGRVTDAQGKAISGVAGVTFAIYKEQSEGAPHAHSGRRPPNLCGRCCRWLRLPPQHLRWSRESSRPRTLAVVNRPLHVLT